MASWDPQDEKKALLDPSTHTSNKNPRENPADKSVVTVEDALLQCGWGRFHLTLLLLCGLAIISEGNNVMALSLLLPSAGCDLHLTSRDKGLVSTLNSVGTVVGCVLAGPFADHWGRRRVLMVLLFIATFCFYLCSFSQDKSFFTICQFSIGLSMGAAVPVVYVYFTEWQHKSMRGTTVNVLNVNWSLGSILTSSLAWLVIPRRELDFHIGGFHYQSWRIFIALSATPSLLCAIGLIFMPDSPRFLLSKRKKRRGNERYFKNSLLE